MFDPGRDGTSQAARAPAALSPDYVLPDERTLADLLLFAREYGKELRYFSEDDRAVGTWGAFFGADADVDEIVAFLRDPRSVAPARARWLSRPHFALFLAFLQLMRHAQDHLNGFTRRHLEHHFQRVLGLAPRPAAADHVNVVFRLAPGIEAHRLSAGTLLAAGKDSRGLPRAYRIDRDLVVNRATVESLRSVSVDRRVTGIREAREQNLPSEPRPAAFMRMLSIALGDPLPGDPLPLLDEHPVDFAFMLAVGQRLEFARSELFLEPFELRSLVRLSEQRAGADAEWAEINAVLDVVGRARSGSNAFHIDPASRAFAANLAAALGGPPVFDGLEGVQNLAELYLKRDLPNVRTFIVEQMHFPSVADFARMMRQVLRGEADWREINRLLELAGKRKRRDPTYLFVPTEPTDLAANLQAAVGPVRWPSGVADLSAYERGVQRFEAYFSLSRENLGFLTGLAAREAAGGEDAPTQREWELAYELLERAHADKARTARRARMAALMGERPSLEGFDRGLRAALGSDSGAVRELLASARALLEASPEAALLERVREALAAGQAPSLADWRAVSGSLDEVQRRREKLPEPVAQKVEWRNLYSFADAQGARAAGAAGAQRWPLFGARELGLSSEPSAATLGWGVGSPLLLLGEGNRRIAVTLGFRSESFDGEKLRATLLEVPFAAEVSTLAGWRPAEIVSAQAADGVAGHDYRSLAGLPAAEQAPLPALQLVVRVSPAQEALAVPRDAAGRYAWPRLRLMLRPQRDERGDDSTIAYAALAPLELRAVHLRVDVDGLSQLRLQNDDGAIDPKKPFEPFGSAPTPGSRLYLGHPELNVKRLDQLRFELEWMGVPADLAAHYANYPGPSGSAIQSDDFQMDVLLAQRGSELVLAHEARLFARVDGKTAPARSIEIRDVPAALESAQPSYRYERLLDGAAVGDDVTDAARFFAWELGPYDFQHAAYPAVATATAVALAAAIANRTTGSVDPAKYQLKPPWTPKLKRLRVGYAASAELLSSTAGSQLAAGDELFHIHPFGESAADADGAGPRLVPAYEHAGELYIGLTGARPPQNVAILFQLAEGSADPELEPAAVEWSRLDGDRWVSLHDGHVLSDSTRGFINSGIVELALEPCAPSRRLPSGRYWLRAAIRRDPRSVCDAVAVLAQAVPATFVDRQNAPDHHARPLPPGSIRGLVEPDPAIAAVEQPFTSYGGRAAELAESFYVRAAERSRHKQRAVTAWDYERLVLERFPQIYKAKCLPADAEEAGDEPGRVDVVVIPDLRDRLPADPFEPKASIDLITDIRTYLSERCPPAARVVVRNPHYVTVQARFSVRFAPGCDIGFCKRQIVEDLNRFLSPWAYSEQADIEIGGKIYSNSIVDFLDRRDYVDYVASLELFSSEDGRRWKAALPAGQQGVYVTTGRRDGVLVAAREHVVEVITEDGYEEESRVGINYMMVELDFTVG